MADLKKDLRQQYKALESECLDEKQFQKVLSKLSDAELDVLHRLFDNFGRKRKERIEVENVSTKFTRRVTKAYTTSNDIKDKSLSKEMNLLELGQFKILFSPQNKSLHNQELLLESTVDLLINCNAITPRSSKYEELDEYVQYRNVISVWINLNQISKTFKIIVEEIWTRGDASYLRFFEINKEHYELRNTRNGKAHLFYIGDIQSEILRVFYVEGYQPNEAIHYDELIESMDPEWLRTYGDQFNQKSGAEKREAVRQAIIRLGKTVEKDLDISNYIKPLGEGKITYAG